MQQKQKLEANAGESAGDDEQTADEHTADTL